MYLNRHPVRMIQKLMKAEERAKNAKKGRLEISVDKVESLVCPLKFNSDECIEIMCDGRPMKRD
jgi:hypothetical protein